MRKLLLAITILTFFLVGAFAQNQGPKQEEETKIVDIRADIMYPTRVGDSSVVNLVGNVVIHHNEAVITCDSAVRYSDKRMECFNRVLINKGTTYIYGDRADYDGIINEARVYAPIIKMVDGDAVLYTYNFTFNTLDNIGIYTGSGTMRHNENVMESERGYYYVDTRDFIGVDQVELRNPDYMMQSDSVAYNLDTEIATFYTRTNIWNEKGEFLTAERGRYFHKTADYRFTLNAYMLTDDQEVWADTIDYNSETENAVLRNNVQIRDEDQKVLAFGDYGQYWGGFDNALLTRNPSMVTFDPDQDSLYVRSDSMFLYTFPYDEDFSTEEARALMFPRRFETDSLGDVILNDGIERVFDPEHDYGHGVPRDSLGNVDLDALEEHFYADSISNAGALPEDVLERTYLIPDSLDVFFEDMLIDTLEHISYLEYIDGLISDMLALPHPVPDNGLPGELTTDDPGYDAGSDVDEQGSEPTVEEDVTVSDSGPEEGAVVASADPGNKTPEVEPAVLTRKQARQERKRQRSNRITTNIPSGAGTAGEGPSGDDGPQIPVDSLFPDEDGLPADSLAGADMPEYDADSLGGRAPVEVIEEEPRDSLQRVVQGYRNVRIFRVDFQAVCDSMIGFSRDSTLHMYIDPVLWNENNQVVSEVVVIHTKNQKIDYAVFTGDPFMSSEVDPLHYNQVKGKQMIAYFEDNTIYRHDVNGNGETYYFLEDEDSGELDGFLVAESADISFFIVNSKMDKIIYRGNPVYTIYPMDKIPLEQDLFLPGFTWEISRRPYRESVFNRTIRPSRREYYESLARPDFPLTRSIERDKERKTRQGIWTDRNDTLSPVALEFLRTLSVDAWDNY